MRFEDISKTEEDIVLEESLKGLFFEIKKRVEHLLKLAQAKRPKNEYEKYFNDLMNTYKEPYLLMRTVISFDQRLAKEDPELPSYQRIESLVKSTSIDEAIEELEKFRKMVVEKQSVVESTYNVFKNALESNIKKEHPYQGYYALLDMQELLEYTENLVKTTERRYTSAGGINSGKAAVTESIQKFISLGYVDNLKTLTESVEEEEDEYYMLVDMKLHEDHDGKKVNRKNFKNTLVTKAKNVKEARKKLKSCANKSLKELNKYLKSNKDKKLKVEFAKPDWNECHQVIKGRDRIRKKNIKGLTGTNFVSTGVMYLKGLDGTGNVSDTPECCPNRKALIGSNQSLSRYINKECKEK